VEQVQSGPIEQLQAHASELEAQASVLRSQLESATLKAQQLDQLRNSDQERLYALEMETSRLRDQLCAVAAENENLRGILKSDHYARVGEMCVRPNFPAKHLGLRRNDGFLVMQFRPAWSNDVETAVRKALNTAGMGCHRADQLNGARVILEVWGSICECGLVIADITDCNPNVMYELGLAEAIGKKILLISQTDNPQQIAFDVLGFD